jgi:iron complex transport system ATP-binding protein
VRPLVEVRGLEFAYPAPDRRRRPPFRLRDLSFSIASGQIWGVIGPNSSGKTTLIRLLTRVVEPSAGEILLDGKRLRRLSRWELARQLAVVPQEAQEGLPFTVEQLVLMGRYPHAPGRYFESAEDRALAREAMAAAGVLELAGAPLDSLSGGERRRTGIARALAQEPRLLILDEPTAHLDLRAQVEVVGLLRRLNRERGVTLLLVSHDLNLAAELSDRLLLLAHGLVARLGRPEEVLETAVIEAAYGCPVVIERDSGTGRPRIRVDWFEAGTSASRLEPADG